MMKNLELVTGVATQGMNERAGSMRVEPRSARSDLIYVKVNGITDTGTITLNAVQARKLRQSLDAFLKDKDPCDGIIWFRGGEDGCS